MFCRDCGKQLGDRFYAGAEDALRAYRDVSKALEDMGLDGFDAEQLIDGDLY